MGDSLGFSRQHLFIPLHRKKGRTSGPSFQRIKKASQSLPPAGGKEIKSFSLATCA